MVHDEIKNIVGSIRNEKLWALGAPTESTASMHIGNIEAFEEYIPPAKPLRLKSFLAKIIRNLALDRYEAAHSQKRGGGSIEIALEELAEIPAPEKADDGELTKAINDFLRSEPSSNSDIFVKRYWYLQSVKEIAAEYGYSESKTASLLFRMRERLKQNLESEGFLL